jgi:hypothetical protein
MSKCTRELLRQLLRPPPLWERAAQSFNKHDWVRGFDVATPAVTPHPTEFAELSAMPSPTRGEGAATPAAT